jgi:type II secretory ATPase GspE/PulE/Tfp pilus assembly ATPase PilB-like protein
MNIELSDMITRGNTIEQLRLYLQQEQCRTLFDDAEEKIALGISTAAESRRELGVLESEVPQ